jgi:glutathione synthase/RimK-type ligase-like ATP-grasp enzyme
MIKKIHLMTTSSLDEVNKGALSPVDQKIWDALRNRGVAGKCFTPNEVSVVFNQNDYSLSVQNEPLEIDVMLVRLTRGAPERSYEVAATFEGLHGIVSDPTLNLVYPGGKLIPYLKRVGGIDFVPTYFFNKSHLDIVDVVNKIPYPLIIKPQAGFQGKGVSLVNNDTEFHDYLNDSEEVNLMAQQYISDIVDEFRVVVVGGKGLGVVRKIGSGIAKNSAQGAQFEAVQDEEIVAFAEKASKFGTADVYGTDVVRTKTGQLYLIENNRSPNFMAFNAATGIAVEDAIIDFVLSKGN